MFKVIKKADILLLIALLAVGFLFSWLSVRGNVTGKYVEAKVNGKLYGKYSLTVNRTVTIRQNGHTNKFIIKNGTAQMLEASCKNQICVHHKPISRANESIVCLPNRVSLEIVGKGSSKEGGGYDAVAH
ncbi:NusG domain II-containing protein [Eubacterium sp. F2]|jgi:hypothetical protein|uniref:NusG domain II-containing protein n=1 Tax=Eubacterium sp. F2 TaxID=3381348 RepID=UPI0039081FC5